MASSVFYKFRSQRDESRVTFDGTGISVFDLKKEVILANNLGKANDFDLAILDKSSGQEFKDDSHIIPRSSSVVVKRVPAARPGKGKAAMYIGGVGGGPGGAPTTDAHGKSGAPGGSSSSWSRGGMSRRFDGGTEPAQAPSKPPVVALKPAIAKDDEAAAMAAMFQAQSANWEETQEKMSHAQRIYTNQRGTGFNGRGGKPFTPHYQQHQPERPLPPSYVCYRCGQKGHWIQDCPTNSDREFDHKPRIKRTTGIPRSFLKAVESPSSNQPGAGVMVTPEGGYVVAQPDSASWQRQVMRTKGLTEADIRDRPSKDPSIVCSIDNKIFRDAVKTPCCEKAFCEECIQTYLLEKDFICPNCGTKIASLDKLLVDKPTRAKVMDYIENEMEASRKEEESAINGGTPVKSTNHTPQPESTPDQQTQQQPSEFFAEQGSQIPEDIAMSQMIADSIPQLQASVQQLATMLQNPNLPRAVRHQTEAQHHQLQMQLTNAQNIAASLAAAQAMAAQAVQSMGMPGSSAGFVQQQQFAQVGWGQFANQQPAGQESAYQRLPLNNRRRNLKRDRPSDFLEINAEREAKGARYWE